VNALEQLHASGQSIWLDTITRELSAEDLFFELAIEDLAIAADHFRPVYEATDGVDGFVSLEVSPALANDAQRTIEEAERPDTYYVSALASAGTVNTLPEKTLLAFRDHGEVRELLTADASRADRTIEAVEKLLRGIEEKTVGLSRRRSGRGAAVSAP